MYNHWIAKIRFKERIEKYLNPLLKPYTNCVLTSTLTDMVRDVVDNWIDAQNDAVFECNVVLELDKIIDTDGSLVDVVKRIKVIPLDL